MDWLPLFIIYRYFYFPALIHFACQYLVTLVSLWTCELLTLIVFPVAKSLLSHSLGFLLQQSLRLYK